MTAELNHVARDRAGGDAPPKARMEAPLKKLPLLTMLLWSLMIAGYVFLPRIFLQEYVQYPLVVLLSVILPVSLWVAVLDGRRILAAAMAAVFLLNAGLLLFVLENNYSASGILEHETGKGILPQVAGFLAENPAKSQYAARQIYQRHGVAVPFRSGAESFGVFAPGDEDKKLFRENFNKAVDMDVAAMNASKQMLTTFLLFALHVGIFILVLLFLLIYEQGPPAGSGRPGQAG
ncbi:MAG: hypothetical protein F9K32_08205 [Desulfobulbaceae bacterium]|nr:MAG: hypothetical protein F9K32_08205 [Desulfobulbaceae bacterium]